MKDFGDELARVLWNSLCFSLYDETTFKKVRNIASDFFTKKGYTGVEVECNLETNRDVMDRGGLNFQVKTDQGPFVVEFSA